ncbi:hypothetical protein RI138_18420 [Streptomyces sp. C11-1]|uniref:Uncharacterized protein n=1 Tax=Streptomyces durocortorensis TaxID=2811104 RepID=A0ABY9VZK3_9ACTN|nr:DUF6585 family protein [Streptomyces durocortorensis]WNF28649.1 hypothetical protein RI138_18420 [Streptomyces durocortorensis]
MAKDQIEHIRTERPSAPATALAAQHGLGDWVDTFATKQGFGWKKWRDWRLYFFTGGMAVTAPTGFTAAYDWGTVRVLQYRTTVNGAASEACSTLIDPAGRALTIGFGRPPLFKSDKTVLGVTSWECGAGFLYPHLWGDHIQGRVTQAQLGGAIARVQQGESVNFGPYTVNRDGVSDKKYSAAWPEIIEIGFGAGAFMFNGHQRRSTVPEGAEVFRIPNLDLFVKLCRHLSPNLKD